MMEMKVCEYIEHYFHQRKVKFLYGMSGANIEDLMVEIFRKKRMELVMVKNEANAAMMAIGQYLKNKEIGIVLTTSGGAFLNTLPILAEAYASRLPLVVISGLPPQQLEGRGGFQDTSGKGGTLNILSMTQECSELCLKVESAEELIQALPRIFHAAEESKKPSVLFIPKNILQEKVKGMEKENISRIGNTSLQMTGLGRPTGIGQGQGQGEMLATFRQYADSTLLIIGEECLHVSNFHPVTEFAEKIQAQVAVSPAAKGLFDHDHPLFRGMTGIMGNEEVLLACDQSKTVILLGTAFDVMTRFGLEKRLRGKNVFVLTQFQFQLSLQEGEISGWNAEKIYLLQGDLLSSLHYLAAAIVEKERGILASQCHERVAPRQGNFFHVLNRPLIKNADVFVDAGNCGAFCLHTLRPAGRNIFYVSLGMGGMGNSLGAAIGASLAGGKRSYVFMGDGSFYISGMEIHTAVNYRVPVTILIFNNSSHGMCTTRERVFHEANTGMNDFSAKTSLALGLKVMFPAIEAYEVGRVEELEEVLLQLEIKEQLQLDTVNVIEIKMPNDELPPFQSFIKKL